MVSCIHSNKSLRQRQNRCILSSLKLLLPGISSQPEQLANTASQSVGEWPPQGSCMTSEVSLNPQSMERNRETAVPEGWWTKSLATPRCRLGQSNVHWCADEAHVVVRGQLEGVGPLLPSWEPHRTRVTRLAGDCSSWGVIFLHRSLTL